MTSGGAERARSRVLRVVESPNELPDSRIDPLHRAIASLGHLREPGDVLRSLPTATIGLGFDRALITATTHDAVVANGPRLTGRPRRVDGRALSCLLGDVARARAAALVIDGQRCAAVSALFDDDEVVPGFLLAPVMVDDECVGVLYADTARSAAVLGSTVRDRFATFALVAGHVVGQAQLRHMVGHASVGQRPATRSMAHPDASSVDGALSGRETEVLCLMAAGRTNAQIGRQLGITEGTVKSHVKGVFRKLRATNRAEAVARWIATRPDPTRHDAVHPPTTTPPTETSATWN